MQQRVAVARALAIDPDVVLLDEPLSNLDARLRTRMRIELRRLLKQAGVTCLFVTHDQAEAFALCDRVAVMNQGRIEQLDRPEVIYRYPATRFVADFVGEASTLECVVRSVSASDVLATPAGSVDSMIRGTSRADLREGESVTMMVRPENIVVARGPSGHDLNRLPGTIRSSAFLGDRHRLSIDVLGHEFIVSSPESVSELADAPTWVEWASKDTIFMPMEADAPPA
jgi:ABC-type Fe3+/spermidine/putrescine transport system ATPase subunit